MSSSPFIASGQNCEHFGKYIEPSVIDRRPDTVPLPVAKAPPFAELKSVALQQVSKVGRPGLEPGTYGLKAFPITPQKAEYQVIATNSSPPQTYALRDCHYACIRP